MKNDQFLKHDASASNNEKLMLLVEKEGMKGYGAYWILLEALRKQEVFSASFTICRPLALRARVRKEYLIHIVKDFDLFEVEEDCFYSPIWSFYHYALYMGKRINQAQESLIPHLSLHLVNLQIYIYY